MKKICSNCNIALDVTPDENHCPECGGILINDTLQTASNIPQRSNLQMDNSIHKGDNIGELHNGNEMHVGGDNAESIDKSTTINNTTTNTTYVYQQPERKMVICDYSGANVYLNDTFICKTCSRRIDKKFYIDKYNCCKECSDKKEATQKELQKVKTETSTDNNNRQADSTIVAGVQNLQLKKTKGSTINVNPDISNISYNDMSRMRHETKHDRNIYIYALIAAILVIGSIWYFGSQNKNDNSNNLTEQTDQQSTSNEINNGDIKSGTTPESNITHKSKTQTALSTSSQTAQPKEMEVVNNTPISSMEEGEVAYNSGNYSKAKILLQQASEEGKAAANYYLALMYNGGKGVSVDIQKSFTYMRKAAEGGEKRAFFPLAEMYRNGDGTEANRSQAKKWYEKTIVSDPNHAEQASQILEVYE